MSEPIDLTGRPDKPWPVRPPDALEFAEQWRIKAATGVDVMSPETYAHGMAACLWLASREWERPLTWQECGRMTLEDLDLVDGEVELAEEDREDPTFGSGTPSNVSSSPAMSGSPLATSDVAPPESS